MIFVAYQVPCYGSGNKIYRQDGKCHNCKAEKVPVHNSKDLISQMYFFKADLQLINRLRRAKTKDYSGFAKQKMKIIVGL